ncbi:MAG: hypothetical protein ABI904_23185 [Chloroflexota bacterium]
MDTFRKIVAGICALLFVISGIIALLAFNIESKAFTSETYKQAFENQRLYEHMPEILANAVHTSIAENGNAAPYLKPLTVADWQATITFLLPPEELKAITDGALESVFDYLNGKADSAVISLVPFKTHLAGPSGVEVIKQILRVQPACTAEQLLQLGLGLLGGDIKLCNPPEELMGLATPLIESQLQVLTVAFPDKLTLISGAGNGTPNDPRVKLGRVRAVMKVTPFFPLFFLFALSVFAVRSLTGWLKWWGYPFLITGAISALFAWLGAPIFGLVVQRVLQNQGARFLPPIFFSTLQETVSVVTSQILKPVAIEGLVLAVLGLMMVLVAAYVTKK